MPFGFFEEMDESAYTGDYQHVKKQRDYSLEMMPMEGEPVYIGKKREDQNETN